MSTLSSTAGRSIPAAPPRPRTRNADVPNTFAFWAFVLYLYLEFGRPPLIASLKLQMVIALLLPLVWLGARDRPWSGVLTAQLAFIAACAGMIPFATNNFAAYFTTRTLYSNVSLAIVMSWLFATRLGLMRFYWAWLLVLGWVGLFGILHGGHGVGGFLGDENDLALACVTAFPFAFYGFERLPGAKRWIAAGCGALLLGAIVASLSRGGFVGLLAALAYCYVTSAHKVRNFFVALAAAGLFFLATPGSYWREMSTISETNQGTADSRQFLWATAWNMFEANPLTGVGGSNFAYHAGQYQARGGRWDKPEYAERNWSGTTVHSTYFQLLSETGLLGTVPWVVMVWLHFRSLGRVRKRVRRDKALPADERRDAELLVGSLSGGMIGALAAGAFLSAAYYPYVYFFSALSVGMVRAFIETPATGATPAAAGNAAPEPA